MERSRKRAIHQLNEIDGKIDYTRSVNKSRQLTYSEHLITVGKEVLGIFNLDYTILGYLKNIFIMKRDGDTELHNKNLTINSDSININTNKDQYGFIWNGFALNPELLNQDKSFVRFSEKAAGKLAGILEVSDNDLEFANIFVKPQSQEKKITKIFPVVKLFSKAISYCANSDMPRARR